VSAAFTPIEHPNRMAPPQMARPNEPYISEKPLGQAG